MRSSSDCSGYSRNAVLWMHRRKFYRWFPVSWRFYSVLWLSIYLRYEGMTTAKLLASYVIDYVKKFFGNNGRE